MIYRRGYPILAIALVGGSFALHLVTVVFYLYAPDRFAAFTVFPIWLWGILGLLLSGSAFLLIRARLSLLATLVWTCTVLLMADETRSLGRLGRPPPSLATPGKAIRVMTFNTSSKRDLKEQFAKFLPDVIFLQEIRSSGLMKKLVSEVYGNEGDYRFYPQKSCGVVVRGRITHYLEVPGTRCQLVTARLRKGLEVQLMNVHLTPAQTNLRLWRRDCWRSHFHARLRRRAELAVQLAILRQKTPAFSLPTIIGGDFNAPPQDACYDLLAQNFQNAFSEVGSGWGNTYPRVFPVLRIDHLFASPELVPEQCAAFTVNGSDHRMMIADFLTTRARFPDR